MTSQQYLTSTVKWKEALMPELSKAERNVLKYWINTFKIQIPLEDLLNESSISINSLLEIDYIPEELFNLQHIRQLEFRNIDINAFPEEINNLENLEYLSIISPNVTSLKLDGGKLKHLKKLMLETPNLVLNPEDLYRISTLILVSLDVKFFYQKDLFESTGIEKLHILNTKISELDDSIRNLHKLKGLYIYATNITECKGMEDMSELKQLDLISNRRLTSLPADLTKLSKLETLDISGNAFTEFPESISHLQNLQRLYFFEKVDNVDKYISKFLPNIDKAMYRLYPENKLVTYSK